MEDENRKVTEGKVKRIIAKIVDKWGDKWAGEVYSNRLGHAERK